MSPACSAPYCKSRERNDIVEEKQFRPYIPADKVMPEFTAVSIILGAILAIVFGGPTPIWVSGWA